MIVVARVALAWIVLALGPLAWIDRNGLTLNRSILANTMTSEGGVAFKTPTPVPHFFIDILRDASDGLAVGPISDLRLFEEGKELGPAHTVEDTIRAGGHGAYSHWGNRIVFSSSDGTDPSTNGRTYRVEFKVYPVFRAELIAILGPIGAFIISYAMYHLLVFVCRRRSGEQVLVGRLMLASAMTLFLIAGLATWLRVTGRTGQWTIVSSSITPYQGLAFVAHAPTFRFFETCGDSVEYGNVSDLRMFENGKELGGAHTSGNDISLRGRGAFDHWNDVIVFSASDSSDPRTNGRAYLAEFTKYIKSAVLWTVIAICCFGIMLLIGARLEGRHLLMVSELFDVSIGQIGAWRFASASQELLRLTGLTLVYTAAMLLIHYSLVAQQSSSGTLKINFEYKVF